jgi:hypothetical protein
MKGLFVVKHPLAPVPALKKRLSFLRDYYPNEYDTYGIYVYIYNLLAFSENQMKVEVTMQNGNYSISVVYLHSTMRSNNGFGLVGVGGAIQKVKIPPIFNQAQLLLSN